MSVRAVIAVCVLFLISAVPRAAADTPGLDLRPGVSIYVVNQATQMQSTCTLGWLVLSPRGEVQALTAGHCRTGPEIDVEDQVSGVKRVAGTWVRSEYSKDGRVMEGSDIGTVALASGLGHSVRTLDGLAPAGVTTAQELRDHPPARICKRGGQTGLSCGPMVGISEDRVAFRAAVDHGDSGGPVWAVSNTGVVTALAVVAGQSNDDSSIAVGQLINPWLVRWGSKLGVTQ